MIPNLVVIILQQINHRKIIGFRNTRSKQDMENQETGLILATYSMK